MFHEFWPARKKKFFYNHHFKAFIFLAIELFLIFCAHCNCLKQMTFTTILSLFRFIVPIVNFLSQIHPCNTKWYSHLKKNYIRETYSGSFHISPSIYSFLGRFCAKYLTQTRDEPITASSSLFCGQREIRERTQLWKFRK